MKYLNLCILCLLFFSGCAKNNEKMQPSTPINMQVCKNEEIQNKQCHNYDASYKRFLRVNTYCMPCDGSTKAIINGSIYVSDVSFNCCKDRRNLDKGKALKKVYIHEVLDTRENEHILEFASKSQTKIAYTTNRLDVLFYNAIKAELNKRGIIVTNQLSHYTIKLDFNISNMKSLYDRSQEQLYSNLGGIMTLKTLDKTKKFYISTKQNVKNLNIDNKKSVDLFIDLLVLQAASKAANEISKF